MMPQQALTESESLAELSLGQWYDLPEDTPGELVDGRLVEEEVPSFVHEILVIFLGSIFRDWVVPRGGFVAGSDAKFAISPRRGRKPDLTVYLPGSRRPPLRGPIDVPPDLAVEIVSAAPTDGRRDRVEKVEDYANFGIRYYWILDPELRSLEVLELGSSGLYVHVLGAAGGMLEKIPGCEGLRLDLDALWAEIDRLAEDSQGP